MPPKKKPAPQVEIPNFAPATSEFTLAGGFKYGMSDDPPMYGQISVPYAKPGCFDGLSFVITGTLRSLKREQAKDLIESCGGAVKSSISGKTNVVIRGCVNVGPSKMNDAKKRGIPIIDEESLFEFLGQSNPNWKPPPPPKIEGGEELPETSFPKSSLLTEKYRPRYLREVVGNLGPIKTLIDFLKNYDSEKFPKCAILNGPPGIGKSTTASLAALYCGYQPLELNASDTRSKKAIIYAYSAAFNNNSIEKDASDKKICLIFDEVDGMQSGDQGGLQQLVTFIDSATNPIICICNNRNDKRFDTLGKRSVDIGFSRAQVRDIEERLKEIAKLENFTISENIINEIAAGSGGDFRQALNMLSFWSLGNAEPDSGEVSKRSEKIVEIKSTVDAVQHILKKSTSLEERFDCFFVDYGLIPLYVHENMQFQQGNDHEWADALESIAESDVISNYVYQQSDFSLLNPLGLMSSIIPSTLNATEVARSVNMPAIWGKMSRQSKLDRWLHDLRSRIARNCSVPVSSMFDSVAPLLFQRILNMSARKNFNTDELLDMMDELEMTLDDFDHLEELSRYLNVPITKAPKVGFKPAAKAEITKKYKDRHCNFRDNINKLPWGEARIFYVIQEMPRWMRRDVRNKEKSDRYKERKLEEKKNGTNKKKKNKKPAQKSLKINLDFDSDLEDSAIEEEEEFEQPVVKKTTPKKKKAPVKKTAPKKNARRRRGSESDLDDDEDLPQFVVKVFDSDDEKSAKNSESEPEADFSDEDDDEEIESKLEDSDEEEKNKKAKKRQEREEKKKKEIEKKIKHRSKKSKTSRHGL